MQWDILEQKPILKTVPFSVEELRLHDKTKGEELPRYHRLLCPDWVNVLPITADRKAILIWQSRAGALKDVLEVPGGAVDLHEKDPTMAAIRELEEETGYTSQRILPLGAINPNPAINNNRLHMFVALGCSEAVVRKHFPDESESIRVELFSLEELEMLVRHGRMDSCLSSLTVMLALKYLNF